MKLLFIFLFICSQTLAQSAITYEFNGGRFGDCLSTYCKAKWFAHKYKLQLFYKPFIYSDQLALHNHETIYDEKQKETFDAVVSVKSEADIKNNKQKNVLFVSNFYSQTPGLYEYSLQNKEFDTEIKKMLTPINKPDPIIKPAESMTAALHVRKGGGFDKPLSSDADSNSDSKNNTQYADQIWPTKFPSDQYYLDQIKVLRKLADPSAILLIYLLTDDPDPATLAQKYSDYLNDNTIQFVYRIQDNSHDKNVVEDFYVMAQCDYLIRSSSLFAKAAQLLGNHAIIIYPQHGYWVDGKVIIDPVTITMRSKKN